MADQGKMITLNAQHVRRFVELVRNTYSERVNTLRRASGGTGKRDLNSECDYPENPDAEYFKKLYDRNPIANRIVSLYPKECWQVQPQVNERDTEGVRTPFEKAWDELGASLRGRRSWHAQEEGSIVWSYLQRLDECCGIGHYGVLLLGLDDLPVGSTRTLADPVQFGPGNPRKLLFVRPVPENMARVTRWETDPGNPRYGRPTEYMISFNDPSEGEQSGIGLAAGIRPVHHSRVIHVADNSLSSDVFGVPRMKVPLDRIEDLKKEYAGAGEGFWQACLPILSMETHPQMGGDVDVDENALKDMLEQIFNGSQRWMQTFGLAAKNLSPNVPSPAPFIDKAIEAICIVMGCPVRIFKGSERGELASSQDDDAWNDRLRQRQAGWITPHLIAPFVDRLIEYGVLPIPPKGFVVSWPDLTSRSDQQKAQVGVSRMQALSSYTMNDKTAESLSLHDFFVMCWGVTDEEAAALVEAAATGLIPVDPLANDPGKDPFFADDEEFDTELGTDPSLDEEGQASMVGDTTQADDPAAMSQE